jgi:hypothetical protein
MIRWSALSASVVAKFRAVVVQAAVVRSAVFTATVFPAALVTAVLCLGWAIAGCGGGYPEPRNQLVASEAAVRAAEVAGAQEGPQSALHLKRAREQVETGKSLIQEGENERAEWVLRRAQSDADLALAVATEEARRKQAGAARTELEQLRDNVRQGNTPQ